MIRPLWAVAGVAIFGTAGVGAAVLVASSGGEEEVVQQLATASPSSSEPVWGTGAGPQYEEPVLITPGKYVSPAGSAEAVERGLAADAADRALPRFEGELNGFRVFNYDPSTDPGSELKVWCGGGEIVDFRPDDRLTYGYLPPGSYAFNPQTASVCEDGSIQAVSQSFATFNASFDIGYQAGERAFQADASADRVMTDTISDRPAVIIRPLTEEGFGQTWVAIATERGFMGLHARGLPLTEVMKIAEGLKCAGC